MNLSNMINVKSDPSNSRQASGLESFFGYVHTLKDALLLLEGLKANEVKCISRRLNTSERSKITSGSTFIFEETQSGVQRWTDGYSWSTSRLKGHFLIYTQKNEVINPLLKRNISVMTRDRRRLSIINYYYENDADNNKLVTPKDLEQFQKFKVPFDFYFRCISPLKKKPQKPITFIPLNDAEEDDSNGRNILIKYPNLIDKLISHQCNITNLPIGQPLKFYNPANSNFSNHQNDNNIITASTSSSLNTNGRLPGIHSLLNHPQNLY